MKQVEEELAAAEQQRKEEEEKAAAEQQRKEEEEKAAAEQKTVALRYLKIMPPM